ncbi:arginine vasopressin-induced protein 1 isoform X2 [Bombina bombina]|nr:arginine vasopressin-induced protein 1 isoform X2 [Bombina bombina]
MGTPASVADSQPTSWQVQEPPARKKASANIFKDIDLLQLQTLFRASGDECAEERARIICEYSEDRRIAEALIQLRKKKRKKASSKHKDRIGTLSVQHFSKLCIHETNHRGSTSTESGSEQQSTDGEDQHFSGTKKRTATWRTTKLSQKKLRQKRISAYLHQIKR